MDLENKKIDFCLVGNGDWGKKVLEIARLISRFNIIGVIDSKTDNDTKKNILNQAKLVYIATNPEYQLEYINYCLAQDKDIMCESPFLCSKEQRDFVHKEVLTKPINKSLFYVNYPYLLDPAFSKPGRAAAMSDFSFMSVKCSGPKFKDNPDRAKKFYSNQAINIIIQIMSTKTHKFDKFIMHDNNVGEFYYRKSICLFSWGYSDIPILEMSVKGQDFSVEKKFTYDQYDLIAPLFQFYLTTERGTADNPTMPRSLSISSLQHCISSEYYSDLFVALNGQRSESTYENLFFSGNLTYDRNTNAALHDM